MASEGMSCPAPFEAPLRAGEFTFVKEIAQESGIMSGVFEYRWAGVVQDGGHVAVKKLPLWARVPRDDRERSERLPPFRLGRGRTLGHEDARTEIGVLDFLSRQADVPEYLLKMRGVFVGADHVWLVTDVCKTDLMTEVVRLKSRNFFDAARSRRHSWEILQAVRYLHRHRIAHRDLSLENILIKRGSIRVMDFGMAVQSHLPCGTEVRFFDAVGKPYYMAPECYGDKFVDVVAPFHAAPGADVFVRHPDRAFEVRLPAGARPGHWCRAQALGYAAQPFDAFAVGVCILIMLTHQPPWDEAKFSDKGYRYVDWYGLPALYQKWGLVMAPAAEAVVLGLTMLSMQGGPNPSRRLSMEAALDLPWFKDF